MHHRSTSFSRSTMKPRVVFFFLLSLLFLSLPASSAWSLPAWFARFRRKGSHIDTIYNFGDSISDTGNLLREGATGSFGTIGHLPYGQAINNATGRCSDGLLMIDFLAEALGLPLLNPYLDKDADFTHGVNFAVAGAQSLDIKTLEERGILLHITNSSLSVQLEWFKDHLKSRCSSKECAKHLEHALIMVGEIGGNDYNYAFFMRQDIKQIISHVPFVVESIVNTTKELINLGSRHLIVPGNFPIGCMPIYLTMFGTSNGLDYDMNNCLKGLNKFAMLHNVELKAALQKLRKEYPHVHIMYADYYNAFLYVLKNAQRLGFDLQSSKKACCGSGGSYNFNFTEMCGLNGTSVCSNPSQYISWDGIHLTHRAYKIMARVLMHFGFTHPRY